MARQGRFGKYGDIKRKERLRKGSFPSERPHPLVGRHIHGSHVPGAKVFIRDAMEADKGFIKALSRDAFEKYGPYENTIPEWLISGFAIAFLACTRKKPIGFAMISRPAQENRMQPVCELLAIAVARALQGRGTGDLIMVEAEKRALGMRAASIVLHSAAGNMCAQKLFERHGFVPCMVKKRYYPNGQEAVMMRKSL
jgi:ribosomal protein S18 acetylase RimI-like enzyme